MIDRFSRPIGLFAALALIVVIQVPVSLADSAGITLSSGRKFVEQTGEAIYTNLCQACHMGEGQGAVGAGRYPALAGNEKLKASGHAVYVVVHGQKAMPPFGKMLTDDQVAAVVNYIRTHFGNDYSDAVTAEDVKDAR